MKHTITTLAALLLAMPAAADIYKCKDATGRLIYSDLACPSKTEVISKPKARPAAFGHGNNAKQQTADAIMLMSDSARPAFSKLKVLSSIRESEGTTEARACLERYRSSFKDPRSPYVVSSGIYYDKVANERFVHSDVSARNGFGGATRTDLLCSLTD